jgi:signal transduction histidine kinase
MFQEKNLSKLIIFTPIVLIILLTTLVTYTQVRSTEKKFNEDISRLKEKLILEEKNKLSQKLTTMDDYIKYKKTTQKQIMNEKIKKRVEIAYDIISNKYNSYTGIASNKDIKKDLIQSLAQIRFENDTYYFVLEDTKKTIIPYLYPINKKLENQNIIDIENKEHQDFLQKYRKTFYKSNEGFIQYLFKKLNSLSNCEKISYIKKFEPFNWFVGYGKYKSDIDKQIKDEVVNRVEFIKNSSKQTIVIYDKEFKNITKTKLDNFIISDLKTNIKKSFDLKDFEKINFYWTKNYEKLIAYKLIKDWNWIILTTIDLRHLENSIIDVLGTKKNEEDKFLNNSIKIAFLVILFGSLLTLLLSKKIELIFKKYKTNIESQKCALKNMNATLESKVDEKTEELEKLNMKLKDKVDEEVLKNRKKDQMLFNQSKMASMGEMIGNIAHQWRQPLSTISTAASGMSIKIDYDLASKEELKKDLELIVDTTQYLSHTIEDFRSFFKATKDKEKFCLTKLIKKDINIMNSAFKNNFIEVVYEFEDVELNTIQNELTQSILNILTNAKDALSQNSSKNRLIIIKTFIKDRFVFITIQDNGGGIDEKIMDKIFEPYFTTKHQSQGTGIGLYMTREIVVKHLNGTIKVKNKNFKHKEKEYLGACFEIKLPLDSLT